MYTGEGSSSSTFPPGSAWDQLSVLRPAHCLPRIPSQVLRSRRQEDTQVLCPFRLVQRDEHGCTARLPDAAVSYPFPQVRLLRLLGRRVAPIVLDDRAARRAQVHERVGRGKANRPLLWHRGVDNEGRQVCREDGALQRREAWRRDAA